MFGFGGGFSRGFFRAIFLGKQEGKNPLKNPRFSKQLFDQNPLREISALTIRNMARDESDWDDILASRSRPAGWAAG